MKDDTAKLPQWKARNERERQEFIDWCCAELIVLDNQLHPDDFKQDDYKMAPEVAQRQRLRRQLERAKMAARNGDPEPLRKLLPEVAEFIYPYRRKQGERRSYQKPGSNWAEEYGGEIIDTAIDDVRQLREVIWPKHYGRCKRRIDDGPSAEEIAGALHGLSEDEVRQAIRARSRRR